MLRMIIIAGTMVLGANAAFGQQTQQVERNETAQSRSNKTQVRGNQEGGMDHIIASCLQIANSEEIELAKFAQQHVSDPEVKAFADHLLKDHNQLLTDLQGVHPSQSNQAKGDNVRQSRALAEDSVEDANTRRLEQDQGVRNQQATAIEDVDSNTSGMMSQVHEMQKVASEACLRLTKEELERHQGADFDKAFVGMQIGTHIGMLAKLEAGSKMASPQLKSTLQNATEMTQKHLEVARQLCAKMAKSDSRKADLDDGKEPARR
jgi:predicted outer membrane protein